MKVAQCDNCKKLAPIPPIGWINLVRLEPPDLAASSLYAALSGQSESKSCLIGIFCTWLCVVEYATARALIAELEEPS